MAFLVIAEPPQQFEAWLEMQRTTPPAPADALRARGQEVFLARSCVLCHSVRGTPAFGRNGPDLTHVGSRTTLAAATLANTSEHLGRWIMDPQGVKPGAKMPPTALARDEVDSLVAYLQGLR